MTLSKNTLELMQAINNLVSKNQKLEQEIEFQKRFITILLQSQGYMLDFAKKCMPQFKPRKTKKSEK